jgi:hypothetical protein
MDIPLIDQVKIQAQVLIPLVRAMEQVSAKVLQSTEEASG